MTACMSCSMPTMVGGSSKRTKTSSKNCTKCKGACTCNCTCKVKGSCKTAEKRTTTREVVKKPKKKQ